MRLWYWFLSVLLIIGLALVILGQYHIFALEEYELGWELSMYGAIILGFLLAVGLLYLERWRRRWWQK